MTNSERKRAYGARLQRHAATVDRHAEEHRQRAAKYATQPAVDVSRLTVRGIGTRRSAHYAPARTVTGPVAQTWETATWEGAQRTTAPKRKGEYTSSAVREKPAPRSQLPAYSTWAPSPAKVWKYNAPESKPYTGPRGLSLHNEARA